MGVAVPATVRLLLTEITTLVVDDDTIEAYSTGTVEPEVDSRLAPVGAPFAEPYPPVYVLIVNLMTCADIVDARLNADDQESAWAAAKRARAMKLIEDILAGLIPIDPTEDIPIPMVLVSDRTEAYASDVHFVTIDETNWLTSSSETREAP